MKNAMEVMRITGKSSFVKIDLRTKYLPHDSPTLETASEPDNHYKDI